jgi:hypothetical protein
VRSDDRTVVVGKRRRIVSRFVYKRLKVKCKTKWLRSTKQRADTRMPTAVTVVDAYLQCADRCKRVESKVGRGEREFVRGGLRRSECCLARSRGRVGCLVIVVRLLDSSSQTTLANPHQK